MNDNDSMNDNEFDWVDDLMVHLHSVFSDPELDITDLIIPEIIEWKAEHNID